MSTLIFTFLCVFPVFLISYLPFRYLLDPLSLDKVIVFQVNLALVALCLFLRAVFSKGKLSTESTCIVGPYLLFVVYGLFSFGRASLYFDDLFYLQTIALLNPVFIVIALSLRSLKEEVLLVVIGVSSIYVLLGMYGLLTGEISFYSNTFQNILVGLDEAERSYQNFNFYLGLFVVATFCLVEKYQRKMPLRVFFITLIGLAILLTLTVGGRSGIVGLSFVLCVYGLGKLTSDFRSKRNIGKCFLLLALISIPLFFATQVQEVFLETLAYSRFLVLFEQQDSSTRLFLYSKALELFTQNGSHFLFGAGIGYFPIYVGGFEQGSYPHNIFLELLAEFGIMGTLLFFLPIAYCLRLRKKVLGSFVGKDIVERTIFYLALYIWTTSCFTGGLRTSWILVFFTFLLFPSLPLSSEKQRSSKNAFVPTQPLPSGIY